jgi:hypothetical protein
MASVQASLFSWFTAEKSRKARGSRLKSCTTDMPETYSCVKAVDLGGRGALAAVALADVPAEEVRRVEDAGDGGEREQRQRPAHGEHDGHDEGEREDIFKDSEHAGGEHLIERIHVRGDAGDEPAHGCAVKEGDRHGLDVTEDLAAQIEHDLLPGPLHQVGLDELQREGERERGEVEQRDLGDAGDGRGAEVVREPGALLGRRREVGIDRDLHKVWPGDVARGLEDDADARDGDLQLVRREVADEPAHQAAVVGLANHIVVDDGGFGVFGLRRLGIGLLGGHRFYFTGYGQKTSAKAAKDAKVRKGVNSA